ncbi:unnamed protein product, partial [Polarella glacialis]
YPYHKERRWSKPYMCVRHNAVAPGGTAVRLSISYPLFDGAAAYYELRRALEAAIPGAQILGDAVDQDQLKDVTLRVLRLNDGRELMKLKRGEELSQMLEPAEFGRLVESAVDNFNWRYGPETEAAKIGSGTA